MVKYSQAPQNPKQACSTSASDLRIHYKNTFEVVRSIRGMTVSQAQKYLAAVSEGKRCIPFTHHRGGVGRTAQAKEFGNTQGRWPTKSVKAVQGLLQNLEANANVKQLDIEKLTIQHAQTNRAQKGRRRTYRAHGRINPYLNCGCHIELWAAQKVEDVKKEQNKTQKPKTTKAQASRSRLAVGEQ